MEGRFNTMENNNIEIKENEQSEQGNQPIKMIMCHPIIKIMQVIVIISLVVCAIAIISLTLCINQVQGIMQEHKMNTGSLDNIEEMMLEIQSIYEKEYIGDPANKEDLEDMALVGFTLGFGDDYGSYTPPKEVESVENKRKEKLVGIGVSGVFEKKTGFYIIRTYDNSPAIEAGIKTGDYIVAADGVKAEDCRTSDEFLENIKGEEGTKVNLTIKTEDKLWDCEIERKFVKTDTVTYKKLNNEVAYIKIDGFTEYTDEEFKEAMEQGLADGIKKYIYDLRNNSGGMADTCISMIDYIIPEGIIAKFDYNDTGYQKDKVYKSDSNELNADIIILVNEYTASASELFSQTLKEYEKAKIVGTKTFGKGTVTSTLVLSNGGTLTLSTARYHTKSGYEIERNGVEPDYEVELADEKLRILYKLPFEEDDQFLDAYNILTGKAYTE